MSRHRFPKPLSTSLRLMALMRPSIMSLGATQCAPALAYASATSAMRSAEGVALIVPSSWRTPQCPCEVYSHRQTSVAMNNAGKSARSFLMARITGPCGSSAGVPRGSFSQFKGTPKSMTLLRPFCTRGPMKFSSRSTPHRRDEIAIVERAGGCNHPGGPIYGQVSCDPESIKEKNLRARCRVS